MCRSARGTRIFILCLKFSDKFDAGIEYVEFVESSKVYILDGRM